MDFKDYFKTFDYKEIINSAELNKYNQVNVNATGTFPEKDNKNSYESNGSKILTVTYEKYISELSSVRHLDISYKIRKLVYDFDVNDTLKEKNIYT